MKIRKQILLVTIMLLSITTLNAKENIEIYNCYANAHQILIQGRTLHKRNIKKATDDDNWLRNLWRRTKQINSNEISEKNVIARFKDQSYKTKGDDEGYFEFNISPAKPLAMGYENINLHIKGNSNFHSCNAVIITNQKLIGIISDFDDTVIVSNVTNKFKLAINTIFKNYKQRKIVPTMLKLFNKILAQNPPSSPSTLFFITGSPQQLFDLIENFLTYHNFPKHVLILKKTHGDNKDPLTDQFVYKTQKIEILIRLYPNMQWIMFGDSGEKDREVYSAIAKKYPSKVKAFYIRDVKTGKIDYFKAFP